MKPQEVVHETPPPFLNLTAHYPGFLCLLTSLCTKQPIGFFTLIDRHSFMFAVHSKKIKFFLKDETVLRKSGVVVIYHVNVTGSPNNAQTLSQNRSKINVRNPSRNRYEIAIVVEGWKRKEIFPILESID